MKITVNGEARVTEARSLEDLCRELGFGEARIVQIDAGVRPSFPDNAPKVIVRGGRIFVNGLYRHGFLVSPVLAEIVADYIEEGVKAEGVLFEDHGEW